MTRGYWFYRIGAGMSEDNAFACSHGFARFLHRDPRQDITIAVGSRLAFVLLLVGMCWLVWRSYRDGQPPDFWLVLVAPIVVLLVAAIANPIVNLFL